MRSNVELTIVEQDQWMMHKTAKPVDVVGRDQVLDVADARDAAEQVEALARVGSDWRLLGGWLVVATANAHLPNKRAT